VRTNPEPYGGKGAKRAQTDKKKKSLRGVVSATTTTYRKTARKMREK